MGYYDILLVVELNFIPTLLEIDRKVSLLGLKGHIFYFIALVLPWFIRILDGRNGISRCLRTCDLSCRERLDG